MRNHRQSWRDVIKSDPRKTGGNEEVKEKLKFTICKRVKTLRGDDHLPAATFVWIFPVGNLLRTMLFKRIKLQKR